MNRLIAVTFLALTCVSCGHTDLRGSSAPSQDGKTYLSVADDNRGHCGPIKVAGKVWAHAVGEPGAIEPGDHTIECGSKIEFAIRPGVVFRFDYWGP